MRIKLKKNSFLEGSIIATLAIIFTKLLGALYVIPFYKIIGVVGGSLYSYAYNIYVLFLNISTAGIPIAISKIISEYNTLKYYYSKEKSYKIGKRLVVIISIISFFILFLFSKQFAHLIIGNSISENSIDDISLVIKSVSFCLIIVPYLSVMKGYLQGHKYISPSSISEVIEQVVRITFLLLGSFIMIKILKKSVCVGVCASLFGAFFGGLSAYLYLTHKIKKNKSLFNTKKELKEDNISNREIIKKIIKYSIPFIIISVVTNVYSMTDLSLIIRGLSSIGYSGHDAEMISSIISTWGGKICIIITSISLGMSINIIPNIVSSYIKKDYNDIETKIIKALSIIFYISLPLTIFISINSDNLYTLFYGYNKYGIIILKYLPFVSFLSSIQVLLNMTLQGLNEYKIVYLNTILGFVLNALLDIPLMRLFNLLGYYPYYGAITSTIIGYSVSIIIIIILFKIKYSFKFKLLFKNLCKELMPLIISFVILLIIKKYIIFDGNRLIQIPVLISLFIIIFGIYLLITYKNKLLNNVLGDNLTQKIKGKINVKNM